MSEKTNSTKRKATPKPDQGARLNVDTSGLSGKERAELAESLVTPARKRTSTSHNVNQKEQKAGKNAGKHTKGAKSEPRPRGRQTTYNEQDAEEIIERLSNGEPLRQICRDDNMPAWRTVYAWMEANKDFSARIARAREIGEDAIGQECLSIADDGRGDTYLDADGNERVDTEHIQRSKLRIETRLKLLAKWNPKKWGEKVDLSHGVQPENPLASLLAKVAGTHMTPKTGKGDE